MFKIKGKFNPEMEPAIGKYYINPIGEYFRIYGIADNGDFKLCYFSPKAGKVVLLSTYYDREGILDCLTNKALTVVPKEDFHKIPLELRIET